MQPEEAEKKLARRNENCRILHEYCSRKLVGLNQNFAMNPRFRPFGGSARMVGSKTNFAMNTRLWPFGGSAWFSGE